MWTVSLTHPVRNGIYIHSYIPIAGAGAYAMVRITAPCERVGTPARGHVRHRVGDAGTKHFAQLAHGHVHPLLVRKGFAVDGRCACCAGWEEGGRLISGLVLCADMASE